MCRSFCGSRLPRERVIASCLQDSSQKDLAVGFNLSKLGIEPRHLAYLVENESKTNNLTKCHIIS